MWIGHWLQIKLTKELIFQMNDKYKYKLINDYGLVWQQYLSRESTVLVMAVSVLQSSMNGILRNISFKICTYDCANLQC
jgi:hypothetical protein